MPPIDRQAAFFGTREIADALHFDVARLGHGPGKAQMIRPLASKAWEFAQQAGV